MAVQVETPSNFIPLFSNLPNILPNLDCFCCLCGSKVPCSVDIVSNEIGSGITMNDSVRVYHWDDIEGERVAD